ncbi:MAG TPA: metallophosphoesterase [Candidatus Hydrogenedentes bacterium]|nr:metallophosphoesterase [Candidatus Hydrogenedentota bacterium]HOV74596.1 metallophosphoesterase [Candidatus Hydrogenedentota bacterium]
MRNRYTSWLLGLMALAAWSAAGETASLLILHTNDVHDHVRTGYEGVGGLPYVAGYVAKAKAERPDVLLLDAGDVTEKGDMAAFASKSLLTYEAMDRIRYDAVTIGNHEAKRGIEYMRECQARMPHVPLLCINWTDKDGALLFPASKIFDVQGVKVAVIGMTLPKTHPLMNTAQTAEALEREAGRLKLESHIQVALCHLGSKAAEELSERAPEVDVFVSAHTHELLKKPVVAKKTGALIVQAGMYARHVGRLELAVDLDAKKIVSFEGEVVEMNGAAVPCDNAMRDWIAAREQELCPEAARIVGHASKPVTADGMAKLAAVAIRKRAGTDIAFCNTGQIMRSPLPKGDIDVNAIFATGGQRGHELIKTRLTGAQIQAYMLGLLREGKGISQWAGFKATIVPGGARSEWGFRTGLKPGKSYSIAMPKLEWDTRFLKVMDKNAVHPPVEPCDFSFTDAVTAYVEGITKDGKTIDAEVETLGTAHAAGSNGSMGE